jgi:hypothetical protein
VLLTKWVAQIWAWLKARLNSALGQRGRRHQVHGGRSGPGALWVPDLPNSVCEKMLLRQCPVGILA